MPVVRLTYYECDRGLLPRVCAVCGVPADDGVKFLVPTRFTMYLIGVLIWVCPPLVIPVGEYLARRRNIRVPMCPQHLAEYRRWDWASSLTFLVLSTGPYLAGIFLLVLLPAGEMKWMLVPAGYFVSAFSWMIPFSIWQTRHVRTTEATSQGIRLSGVHADFVQAVRDDRAADPARLAAYGDARDDYDDESH
jgi:hypothetical protein